RARDRLEPWRSVKPPAQPTLVRTQHLPPPAPRRCPPSSEALSGPPAGAPPCPATSDPHRPPPASHGTCAEWSQAECASPEASLEASLSPPSGIGRRLSARRSETCCRAPGRTRPPIDRR